MTSEPQETPPVIFPGQHSIVVTDEGDTEVREVLIPPPPRPTDQLSLGLSEV